MSEYTEWQMKDFRAWLQAHEANAEVGTSDTLCDCPLARWRADLGESVSISAEVVVFLPDKRELRTQEWVEDFIHELDKEHIVELEDDDYDYLQEPVTALECLDILQIME